VGLVVCADRLLIAPEETGKEKDRSRIFHLETPLVVCPL
jgi:hypothetical protein